MRVLESKRQNCYCILSKRNLTIFLQIPLKFVVFVHKLRKAIKKTLVKKHTVGFRSCDKIETIEHVSNAMLKEPSSTTTKIKRWNATHGFSARTVSVYISVYSMCSTHFRHIASKLENKSKKKTLESTEKCHCKYSMFMLPKYKHCIQVIAIVFVLQ